MNWRQRYQAAHQRKQDKNGPSLVKDFGYLPTQYPKVNTANGLTRMIENFLNWSGHRATRINTQGRLIDAPQRQASGISLQTKKWIPGTTRRGTADLSATINGRSVMLEIKVGNDRPSEYQLAEQARERAAGGSYEFIHTPEEFFEFYDKFVSSSNKQTTLL